MTALRHNAHPDEDAIARYVAATLPADELRDFEVHLLTCAACEAAVREGAAIHAALSAAGPPAAVTVSRRLPRWRLLWPLPALAAAVTVALLAARAEPLERLGEVSELPVFRGLPVRSSATSAERMVDSGMVLYGKRDYRRAADVLGAASGRTTDPGVSFYLGLARLAAGDASAAASALRSALEPPGNPYATDARFYLAKASLRLGAADSALVHLSKVPPTSPLHGHARALMDSVRRDR